MRGCLLGISGFLGLCIALPALALFILDRTSAAPIIPPYPNVEWGASYTSRWGMELFGEDFWRFPNRRYPCTSAAVLSRAAGAGGLGRLVVSGQ